LADVVRVTCHGPARVWSLQDKGPLAPGFDGDLVVVDPRERGPLRAEWLESRSPCSPYAGWELAGWPVATVLRGQVAYERGQRPETPRGRGLRIRPPMK
jgi:dihydroorotase